MSKLSFMNTGMSTSKKNDQKETCIYLHSEEWASPSFLLKESFIDSRFFILGESCGPDDLFFSSEEEAQARQGRMLLGSNPQLCNVSGSTLPGLSFTQWAAEGLSTWDRSFTSSQLLSAWTCELDRLLLPFELFASRFRTDSSLDFAKGSLGTIALKYLLSQNLGVTTVDPLPSWDKSENTLGNNQRKLKITIQPIKFFRNYKSKFSQQLTILNTIKIIIAIWINYCIWIIPSLRISC